MQEAEKIHYGVMNKREARFFINRDKSTKEFVNLFESDASIKTIRLLIEEGIDINALIYIKKQKPKRVVEHAIKIKSFLRKEAIMYELLRAKVDVDFFVDWTDRFGDGYKGNFNESKAFKSLLKEVFLNKFLNTSWNISIPPSQQPNSRRDKKQIKIAHIRIVLRILL